MTEKVEVEIECPSCEGTGAKDTGCVFFGTRKCRKCKGKGKIKVLQDTDAAGKDQRHQDL